MRRDAPRLAGCGVILALRQYPQGGDDNKPKQPTESPSPLMGEESKSLSQCLTRDQRVKQDSINHTTLWIDESPMNLYEILGFSRNA